MTFIIILVAYILILFAIAFASRRSMGMATVALAAGALLASIWTDSLTPIVASTGVVVIRPPLTSIVSVVLTILPALLVLVRSPRVKSHGYSIFSSLVFALLAAMLTYGAFSNAVILDEASKEYVRIIVGYQNILITLGVCTGLAEAMLFHRPHQHEQKKK